MSTFETRRLGIMATKTMRACALAALLSPSLALAASSGHSLKESLSFVRANLAAQGLITYVVSTHDTSTGQSWSNTMTGEASNVTMDVAKCRISFHWVTSVDGGGKQNLDQWIDFAKGRKVTVVNREQELRGQVADGGHPSWVSTVSPPLWVVTVTLSDTSSVMDFTNQNVAERVTRAIDHIMDLCGAQKEDF